jgi:hypothetical protein
MDSTATQEWIRYAIPIVILGIVLAFRIRRMNRDRPLKVERLWIVPAIYLVVAGVTFWHFPPAGMVWLWCALALAAGVALGWQRGRLMRITVDPATHEISQRTSPAAMLFILALIAIRSGARNSEALGLPAFDLDVMAVTDVAIAFALGLLTAQRAEMFLRARRLLEAARAS